MRFLKQLQPPVILESKQVAICWNKEGSTFQIQNPVQLTDQILPQYFKYCNFQSYLRQLNMYGFKKLKNKQGKNEFIHYQFRKGFKNNLLKIKRRNQEDIKQSLETLTKEFQSESYLNEHEKVIDTNTIRVIDNIVYQLYIENKPNKKLFNNKTQQTHTYYIEVNLRCQFQKIKFKENWILLKQTIFKKKISLLINKNQIVIMNLIQQELEILLNTHQMNYIY